VSFRVCSWLFFFFQKIFSYSEQANQNPEKFYDESSEIEIEDERNDYQTRADGIKQRIKNTLAANFSELQKNVCENYDGDANRADKIIPGILHPVI
jgi:hypothetical protein